MPDLHGGAVGLGLLLLGQSLNLCFGSGGQHTRQGVVLDDLILALGVTGRADDSGGHAGRTQEGIERRHMCGDILTGRNIKIAGRRHR